MEMTARITGDAKISTLKNDKQVVNFNVAINDSYRAKGSNEPTKIVTYVQCDYWVNPGVAQYLTKGTLVELQGRVGANAYMGKDGEAKATLTFHVNTIKLHGSAGVKNETPVKENAGAILEPADDLPF
jgi:single-strand DNA-binding protein